MKQEEINKLTREFKKLGFELSHEDKDFNLYFKGNIRLSLDFKVE